MLRSELGRAPHLWCGARPNGTICFAETLRTGGRAPLIQDLTLHSGANWIYCTAKLALTPPEHRAYTRTKSSLWEIASCA